jgi:KDO2-lipid IV(A) lauroyltransferase
MAQCSGRVNFLGVPLLSVSANLSHPKYWPSWLLVGAFRLLGRLPFPLLWAAGTSLGRLSYHLAGSRRRVARRNIETCFPALSERERDRIVARHFGWLGVAAVTQGVAWGISRQRLAKLVKIRGREEIDALLSEGRSVIVMVPHFVGLELGGAAFSALVHPGAYMYQRIRNAVIDAQMRRSRTQFGSLAVERKDALRALVREIRKGTPFFYLPDQDPGRLRGTFAPFCGIAAATVPMLSRFAQLTDGIVIPLYARFLPRGRGLELIFDPPLDPFPTGDLAADTALMNRIIEQRMRTMPEQYFWVHRRFKTRPAGEPPFYEDRRR